jgi:hypothetical protein
MGVVVHDSWNAFHGGTNVDDTVHGNLQFSPPLFLGIFSPQSLASVALLAVSYLLNFTGEVCLGERGLELQKLHERDPLDSLR